VPHAAQAKHAASALDDVEMATPRTFSDIPQGERSSERQNTEPRTWSVSITVVSTSVTLLRQRMEVITGARSAAAIGLRASILPRPFH
jgi:hypothetical protein